MKFNDDSLMLFDLDSLDYTYDTVNDGGISCTTQYVDFDFDLELSNTIKSSLIDEIDLLTNETDFAAEFCEFTDSLITSSNLTNPLNSASNSSTNPSNNSSHLTSNLSNVSSHYSPSNQTTSFMSTNESKSNEMTQDRRDVRKKLLDMTQRKLTNTLCYDNKLRNQVLLKSALKNVNSIDEDNLLGTKSTLDKQANLHELKQEKSTTHLTRQFKLTNKHDKDDMYNDQDSLAFASSPRKRNYKCNSLNQANDKEMLEEKNKIKKQKLCHQLNDNDSEEYFIDENNFNYNDELTLNNLANCFIRLKTQQSHD